MKKKIIFMLLAALLLVSLISCGEKEPQIKNVILLIPDGGGYGNFDFANDVKEVGGFFGTDFKNRTDVAKGPMFMKDYLAGSAVTNNVYGEITDSAAAGTAIATGRKTINGYIGLDASKKPVASILEAAQSLGKSTGIISTYEWMHATPASFTAHAESRNNYVALYQQIENQKVDVVLGSGYGAVEAYATIENAKNNGYKVIENEEELMKVQPGDKIWGNMTKTSSPLDIHLSDGQPTLSEMTRAAITALSGNEKGFFLMVEGSKVDSGGHSNDAVTTTSEYMAFDEAFKVAVEFAKERDDTAVIAIPDHDTGAMKYDEIENKEMAVLFVQTGKDTDYIQWGTTGHSAQNVGVWAYLPEGVEMLEGLNGAVGDSKEQRENHLIDNTEISPYIASLFGVDLGEVTDELFVDVTDIGRYSESSERFFFNKGARWVYPNQSVYFNNKQEIDMDGQVAVLVGDRFYVPKSILTDEDLEDLASVVSTAVIENEVTYKVSAVVVAEKQISIKKGETAEILATVEGENNPPQDVTYSIENAGISESTVIDENGKLTIGEDEANSSITVMVKSAYDGSKIDICNVVIE